MTKSNWYFKNSGFQHTAARRRLEVVNNMGFLTFLFQHTAARRRLDVSREVKVFLGGFQHTAARRRLAISRTIVRLQTHGFNTQPPEGGWCLFVYAVIHIHSFNTQPPEGGWASNFGCCNARKSVSTHSRPKAAG